MKNFLERDKSEIFWRRFFLFTFTGHVQRHQHCCWRDHHLSSLCFLFQCGRIISFQIIGTSPKPGVCEDFSVTISFFIRIQECLMECMSKVLIRCMCIQNLCDFLIFENEIIVVRYKGNAKRNSNHSPDESYHIHRRWVRAETFRLCLCVVWTGICSGIRIGIGHFLFFELIWDRN